LFTGVNAEIKSELLQYMTFVKETIFITIEPANKKELATIQTG
jgi:hypothetical protein